jgi:F0F1-type ATP synthase delta subunit
MKKISIQMGTEEYTKAYSEFAVEQPNLQKLLGDVEYTREDTYHFFIEIVSSYTTVIERFMTRMSDFSHV